MYSIFLDFTQQPFSYFAPFHKGIYHKIIAFFKHTLRGPEKLDILKFNSSFISLES